MIPKFDVAVIIGRFQPFHLGHAKLLRHALETARFVVVVLGSDQKARDPYNPFTSAERIEFIRASLGARADALDRVRFVPVRDVLYSDHRWLASTVNAVHGAIDEIRDEGSRIPHAPKIALVGNQKDLQTKAYIDLFAGTWELVAVDCWHSSSISGREGALAVVSATDVRTALFQGDFASVERLVPSAVAKKLAEWREGMADTYKLLCDENTFYRDYKRSHEKRQIESTHPVTGLKETLVVNPYGVMFQTVDAVVVQNGHVLLVKRRNSPGKGLWALPGGFLKPDETRLEGILRELQEETRIKLPEKILRGSLRETRGFDHPRRSLRGRTITEAFFFRLDDTNDLPKVRGGDDAARAVWVPFADLMRRESEMFEDHFHIIEYFLARV